MALHAGWRGSALGIASKGLRAVGRSTAVKRLASYFYAAGWTLHR